MSRPPTVVRTPVAFGLSIHRRSLKMLQQLLLLMLPPPSTAAVLDNRLRVRLGKIYHVASCRRGKPI